MKISRRFRFQVGWRLLVIAAAAGFFFYWLRDFSPGMPAVLAVAVFVYMLFSLFRYIDRSNRGLARFLQAVRYSDFSLSAGIDGLGSSFDDLNTVFREIIQQFQRTREEKEEQHRYLQTVIQHIGVGLISLRADGTVDLLNNAAKRLLHIPHLRRITDLPSPFQPLVRKIKHLTPGERTLIKLELPDEEINLSLFSTEFKRGGDSYRLVSLQNIQSELEEKEAEAWQSLTRVLTHEIMNSLTPIASLAATSNSWLASSANRHEMAGSISTNDITEALQTIDKRSQGLMRFVQAYRNIALIPKPQFKVFPLAEYFQRLEKLLQKKLDSHGIAFAYQIEPSSLELTADPDLIEQTLINLILNAIEALTDTEKPQITVSAAMNDQGRVVIQVSDNGPGIAPETREKIFIPFFTTKKEGSGIGLSFSRQVMRMHHGTISVYSQPNERTTFSLRF